MSKLLLGLIKKVKATQDGDEFAHVIAELEHWNQVVATERRARRHHRTRRKTRGKTKD